MFCAAAGYGGVGRVGTRGQVWGPPVPDAADVIINKILDRNTVEPLQGFTEEELQTQKNLQKEIMVRITIYFMYLVMMSGGTYRDQSPLRNRRRMRITSALCRKRRTPKRRKGKRKSWRILSKERVSLVQADDPVERSKQFMDMVLNSSYVFYQEVSLSYAFSSLSE